MKNAVLLSILVLVLVLVMALFLWPSHHYAEPKPEVGQISGAISIDVYIDGSGSMKHFLTTGAGGNTFREFLRSCEFALTSGASQGGWDQSQRRIRFWKFGGNGGLQRLDHNGLGDEGSLRELADNPARFNLPSTPIETAIGANPPTDVAGAASVRILISDFYQSDGKLERPGVALARHFLTDGHGAVAIYGVRNPYQGSVDDLPGAAGQTLPDAATSMPFYIVIAGRNAADVRHAQALLTEGEYGSPLRRAAAEKRLFATYFSHDPGMYETDDVVYDAHVAADRGDGLWHFSSEPVANPKRGEEGLAQAGGKGHKTFSARVPEFDINRFGEIPGLSLGLRVMKKSLVGVSWLNTEKEKPIIQTSDALPVGGTTWRVRALFCEMPKKEKGDTCVGPPAEDARAAERISVCAGGDSGRQAQVCEASGRSEMAILIDRSGMTRGRRYLIAVEQVAHTSSPGGSFSAGSDWMRHWNLTSDEIYAMVSGPKAARKFPADATTSPDPHPGKTPNLAELLSAMDGFLLSSSSGSRDAVVNLKTFYVYVDAR